MGFLMDEWIWFLFSFSGVIVVVAGLAARQEIKRRGQVEEYLSVKERRGRPAVVRSEQPGRETRRECELMQ